MQKYVRRVAEDNVEARVGPAQHFRKLVLPVESVDPEGLGLVEAQFRLFSLTEVRADEAVAASNVRRQVGQRSLLEEDALLSNRLLRLTLEDLRSNDSFVTSTACGSMSTPKM